MIKTFTKIFITGIIEINKRQSMKIVVLGIKYCLTKKSVDLSANVPTYPPDQLHLC